MKIIRKKQSISLSKLRTITAGIVDEAHQIRHAERVVTRDAEGTRRRR